MKLSFSTRLWDNYRWQDFVKCAVQMNFDSIELHVSSCRLEKKSDSPFSRSNASRTVRALSNQNLRIVCLDSGCDLSDDSESVQKELVDCIKMASCLAVPFLRVKSSRADDSSLALAEKRLRSNLPLAEESRVTFLVETAGAFCDTRLLRDFLNRFSDDRIGALWDLHHPYFYNNETPENTIQNLGAFVQHVHVKDSVASDASASGSREYCLLGEGDLPMTELIQALGSVNYNGCISLEWDPAWMPEMDDMESVLAHFSNFMARFDAPSRSRSKLYSNKAGTGHFVWRKDNLIDTTFSRMLDKQVEHFPDQLAFKYTTLSYTRTYSQFRDDVNECARALVAVGVGPGKHVAVWATNIPQWYITFWAATKIGAVLVTVNTAYKIHELEYLLRQSDTHTLVMERGYKDNDYCRTINELCPELKDYSGDERLHLSNLPFLRNVISVGFSSPGCMGWDEFISKAGQTPMEEIDRLASEVDPQHVCNMQYTSGTTGFPKGVMLTHYNIVNNGKCIGDRMDLSTADRMMIQVPMFHCFGMVLAMTASMTHAATLLPLPYFSPKSALACINQEHITCFHGVPTMFIAMLEHADFKKTDFSYMRTGIMAGSPCPVSIMNDVVQKMNMREITIVYGQTEASPGCTMSSTDDSVEVRVSTVGRPLPEIECAIEDPETGEFLPDGQIGEFVARGYNIMKGYYKMPEATSHAIDKDQWLHTGDLAARTPEGNYRITGRLKDMIIRGGENIYPKEIEEFLYTHEKVQDVQVIGVPDRQYGEEIMACIILKKGETATEEEMKEFVKGSMARHKVPRYVEFVSSFPMNVAGKILKYKMREDAIQKLGLQKDASIVTA